MTNLTVSRAAASAISIALPTAAGSATSTATLLPAPTFADVDVSDAIMQLLQASSQMNEQQMLLGKSQVHVAEQQRKEAALRRKEALDRAIEAARKAREEGDGGPFSFVTDNVGLTGLIGIATFNWGLVAADITAHQTGLTNGGTNLLDAGGAVLGGPLFYLASQAAKELAPEELNQAGITAAVLGGPMGYALERAAEKTVPDDFAKRADELTTIKDDDVRLANKVALTIALAGIAATATVLSGGTSTPALVAVVGIGISATTQVAAETGALQKLVGEKAAVYVALGGAITGAALTLGGSLWSAYGVASQAKTLLQAKSLMSTLKATANVLEGAAAVGNGVSTTVAGFGELERAELQHKADTAKVQAEEQKQVLKRIERIVDAILDDLQEAKESAERATETLQATLNIKNQTMLRAGSMKV
jgi:hypothetical protein